jgi:hypothetical protein
VPHVSIGLDEVAIRTVDKPAKRILIIHPTTSTKVFCAVVRSRICNSGFSFYFVEDLDDK